ncbi:calcitonin gene-related peptide type 1 receptor [Eurytemora carolleeae]|uniref:calcitonin gene-related peptide type 1 receptor n=1 Tax=Eurytemora carolleeae TaxID=1294199 RepID=UPI000C765F4C|nr:calcitonin gene-related peptide type 1 receptor [Eurytemora carolleeae]|eukprot:XP_023324799.1 calcitonin gene-related peptide type 1 receptor-like [Eurytemora affinis]
MGQGFNDGISCHLVMIIIVMFVNSSLAEQFCRFQQEYLTVDKFSVETCKKCLHFIPDKLFRSNASVMSKETKEEFTQYFHQAYLGNLTKTEKIEIILYVEKYLEDPDDGRLLEDCCSAAEICCLQTISSESTRSTDICPSTWDGWQCWSEPGETGMLSYGSCPKYIYFFTHGRQGTFSCDRQAERFCTEEGWFRRGNYSYEWTNYQTCSKTKDIIKWEYTRLFFYFLSVCLLIPAIIIFQLNSKFNVSRIKLHKYLFLSLLLFILSTIIFRLIYFLPSLDPDFSEDPVIQNTWACNILTVLTKYLRLSNYAWIWNEGYYLNRLLQNTFEDKVAFSFLHFVGWVVPAFPTVVYSILRSREEGLYCWAYPSSNIWFEWVINIPGLIVILSNLFFFFNITRILVFKLNIHQINEPYKYRKTLRACGIIIPLFGLQWILTIYRFDTGECYFLVIYNVLDMLIDCSQGTIVAFILCYRTEEVQQYLLTVIPTFTNNVQQLNERNEFELKKRVQTQQSTDPTSFTNMSKE